MGTTLRSTKVDLLRDGLQGRALKPLYAYVVVLKRVIPCLDVDAGRVVKGTNFVGLRDAGDPVELAERYDLAGTYAAIFFVILVSVCVFVLMERLERWLRPVD